MKRSSVALGWLGAAALLGAAWRLAQTAPFEADRTGAELAAEHLAGQRLVGATLALAGHDDPFELVGSWRGTLELPEGARQVAFLAPLDVVVERATLGGVALGETHDPFADWIARSAEERLLGAGTALRSGPFELDFRLPLRRRGDGTLWLGRIESLLVVGATPDLAVAEVAPGLALEPLESADRANDGAFKLGATASGRGARLLDRYPPLASTTPREAFAGAVASPPSSRPPACSFALDEASGTLAIATRRTRSASAGVLLLPLAAAGDGDDDGDSASRARWHDLDDEPRAVAFAAGGAVVVVATERPDEFVLLELATGTRRRLVGELSVSSASGLVLEAVQRAPGTYVQRLHDLAGPRTVARRVDGLRRVAFVEGDGLLVRARVDGRAECIDASGVAEAVLPCARGSCRAVLALPYLWCALVDTATGTQLQFCARDGRSPWRIELPLHVSAVQPAADGVELLLFCESPPPHGDDGAPRHQVVRLAPLQGERPALVWGGAFEPLPIPGSNGLLFATPASAPGSARGLAFATFVALAADAAAAPRRIGAAVRLDTPPAFGAGGRYLYYLRAPEGTLWRHDFLTGHDEPLALAAR
ncbi:MAG: hypothetical protein JNL90_09415 [Planctomycetes bacterium]|nr:hypothetical protein [Planctomycetota bacterium]